MITVSSKILVIEIIILCGSVIMTHQNNSSQSRKPLVFLHFNDVYDIQQLQKQPKAGAAHFKTMLDRYRDDQTLTFFAGDVFAPSILSRQYNGQNMILPLNSFKIDVATFGNHQLDYKLQRLTQLVGKTNFPWLNTNMINLRTERRMVEGLQYIIFNRGRYKIGVFSLTEQQIMELVLPQYLDFCKILDPNQIARKMVDKLRNQLQCDIIIALTHMTLVNDRKLALQVDGIDINLGGHDHSIAHQVLKDTLIVKSGADFKYFSKIQIQDKQNPLQNPLKQQFQSRKLSKASYQQVYHYQTSRFSFIITLVQINHQKAQIVPDPIVNQYIQNLYAQFRQKLQKVALYTRYPIDLRFRTIRNNQSPYLNFMAQLFRHVTKSDLAIIHSGSFRQDRLIEPGPITLRTYFNFIKQDITAKVLNGSDLYIAFENSVSMYPSISGRFAQYANVQFVWDDQKPPMSRIQYDTIRINGQPIVKQKLYKIAMRDDLAKGIDGYNTIKASPYAENVHLTLQATIMGELLDLNEVVLRDFKFKDKINVIEKEGKKFLELLLEQNFNTDKVVLRRKSEQQQL